MRKYIFQDSIKISWAPIGNDRRVKAPKLYKVRVLKCFYFVNANVSV